MKKLLPSYLLLFFAICAKAQAPSAGRIAYFNFQNSLNSSGLTHAFTDVGTVNVAFSAGKYGQSIEFTGTQALVNQTLTAAITANGDYPYTIAWWEYRANNPQSNYSTSIEMGQTHYYRAVNSSSCGSTIYGSRFEFGLKDNTVFKCLTLQQQLAISNAWVHHAIVYSGVSVKYYIDGVASFGILYPTSTNAIYFDTNKTFLGSGSNGSGVLSTIKNMTGKIDELYVYNRTLSASEINLVLNDSSAALTNDNFETNYLLFRLSPNPASDLLKISMVTEIHSVEIYSLLGQKVLESNQKEINISDLSKGLYMVRVQDVNNGVSTQKLLVE